MAGAGSPQSLRKALKTVGFAKANGDFKVLDIAISKATKHNDALPKEKHVLTILGAVSASRPRAEVAYCIHGLAKRLSKAHSWKVALKTVIVIHRALREVDDTFCDALIKYSWSRGHILNLSHSWDETSPSAWGYSTWVRLYASYLEERLESFRVLKYDVQKDHSRTKELETTDLLRQLPALQQLLSRLLDCQPEVGTIYNSLIQYAITMVAGESAKLYAAITDGIVNLVDKFFEMQHDDAVRGLEIYKRSGSQAERLSEFFEICRSLNVGRGLKFFKIQQPPESFLTTMEDYVKEPSGFVALKYTPTSDDETDAPKETILVEGDLLVDHEPIDNAEEKPNAEQSEAAATSQVADLLSFDDVIPVASESGENNSMALALVQSDLLTENPSDSKTEGLNPPDSKSDWEIEVFTPSTLDAAAVAKTKLIQDGVLDRSTLDSLYEMATTPNQNMLLPPGQAPSNPFEDVASSSSSSSSSYPAHLQMAIMTQQQQQYFMMQQQQLHSMVQNQPSPGQNPQLQLRGIVQNPSSPCQNLQQPLPNTQNPQLQLPENTQNPPSPCQTQQLQLPGNVQNSPSPCQNPSSGNPFATHINNSSPQDSYNGLI